MVSPQPTPTFLSVAPRFVVPDLELALAFYERLGFRTDYHDEGFAIVKRDGAELHFKHDPDLQPGRHSVCYITVTESEALYRHCLPLGAVQGHLTVQPYGVQEFVVCDPFNNLLIFSEPTAEQDKDAQERG